MVEAVEKQVKKMTFDDLIDDPKKEEEKAEAFLGYIDSEDKSQGGAGEEKISGPLTAAPQAIRARQQSCMIKDLDPDEVPEFWKELEAGGGQRKPKLTTKEILKKDTEDEALQRYKRALLGDLADESKFTGEPPLVEFLKIEILCPERPDGPIRLEFSDSKKAGVYKTQEYVLKQKSSIQMRVTFKVYNDIVQGLKLCTVVKKTGFVVEKGDEVLGTFAPVPSREYVIDLQPDETPGGFMARGQYTGKALFIDNDGIVHHQFDYKFNIKKTWD